MKRALRPVVLGGLGLFIALFTNGGMASTESPRTTVISDSTSIPYFTEDFDGTSLDSTKWRSYTYPYQPNLSVGDGFLNLGFPPSFTYGYFPLVNSVRNPFPPSGEFVLSISVQYTEVGVAGTGIAADIGIPRIREIPTWAAYQKAPFAIWQDSSANNELVIEVNGKRAWGSGKGSLNLDWHNFSFHYREGRVAVYLDGILVVPSIVAPRPTALWMGNYVGRWGDGWSSFKVDFVRVMVPLTDSPRPVVVFTQGIAETLPSGSSGWKNLSPNDTLSIGDQVRTKAGVTLLGFVDGSLLRLAEETQLQLREHRKGNSGLVTQINLAGGTLWGYLNPNAGASFETSTAAGAMAAAAGGQWELESSGGVTTTLMIYSGSFRLTDKANSKAVTAGAGYSSTVTPGNQPSTPITFTMSSIGGTIPVDSPSGSYWWAIPLIPVSSYYYPITSTDGLIGVPIETVLPQENGNYSIPAAPLQVVVAPSKMAGWSAEPTSRLVTVSPGQSITNANFTLKKDDSIIKGLTRDDAGSPLSGVLLTVYPADRTTTPLSPGSATVSSVQGDYTLNTAAGVWEVTAFLGGRIVTPTQQVAIGSGQTISDTNFTLTMRRTYLPVLAKEYISGW